MSEQEFLDAINRAKGVGYVDGMRAMKREPLSDEEILKLQDKVPYSLGSDLIEFARAIEERHGIK